MKTLILCLALVSLNACTTVPLTSSEAAVKVMRKSDPDKACKEVSRVTSPGLAAFSEDGRLDNLKRATIKAGGDTVLIDRTDENGTIFGVAFKCGT